MTLRHEAANIWHSLTENYGCKIITLLWPKHKQLPT